MGKYDATIKNLVEARPGDWLAYLDLTPGTVVAVVDGDVSSVTAAADKVLRVDGPTPYIAHLEFQSGVDETFDRRMLLYYVLLRHHHGIPVRTVAVFLHPRTQAAGMTGRVSEETEPCVSLDFTYRVVRLWEQPVDRLLSGGLGILPLAPAAANSEAELARAFERIEDRLSAETTEPEADELLTAAYILSGLRHRRDVVDRLLKGVRRMKDSDTYQAIVEEGEARGARAALLRVGRRRFGPPDGATLAALETITDPQRLEEMVEQALTASSWRELLAAQG